MIEAPNRTATMEYRTGIDTHVETVDKEATHVNLYPLNDPSSRQDFFNAMRSHALSSGADRDRFLLWRIGKDESQMIERALSKGYLLNEYGLQLLDHAKLTREVGIEKRQQFRVVNTDLKEGVIAEFPWLNEGRFVALLPDVELRQVVFSRNTGIFSEEAFKKLRETRIAIIGVGVGFSIAETLIWLGAENLVVVDGGKIAPHDTQRLPSAGVHNYNQNHAIHFIQRAYDIFPYGKYFCYPKNIGLSNTCDTVSIGTVLSNAGITIEEIDQLYLKGRIRQESSGPLFMGSDVGLRGINEVYYPGDPLFGGRLTVEDMALLERAYASGTDLSPEMKTAMAGKIVGRFMSQHFMDAFAAVRATGGSHWPQSGIAARLTSAIVATSIMKYLEGQNVKNEVMIDLSDSVISEP